MIFSTDLDEEAWHHFVYHHPLGNIHQSPQLHRVYQQTKNYEPRVLGMLDEKTGEIRALVAGVSIREDLSILSSLSRRMIVFGGPLVSPDLDEGAISDLLASFDGLNRRSCIFCEVRNLCDMSAVLHFPDWYRFVGHLNYLIDLNQPGDAIWNRIHKGRRHNIRRAEKEGVTVEEIHDPEQLPVFYHLLEETYRNAHVPLPDISLFSSAFTHLVPGGLAKFYLAGHQGRYIGGRAVLLYRKTIFDWYAGSAQDASALYPNDYLVWHVLRWGKEHGYGTFDFGGAGHPDRPYGPREFKRRFGGELVNYGRNIHVYSPVRMKMAEVGLQLYQSFFHRFF
jgi:CelD/BcsL family acetyltransferase involved in cellulose biosynthesis